MKTEELNQFGKDLEKTALVGGLLRKILIGKSSKDLAASKLVSASKKFRTQASSMMRRRPKRKVGFRTLKRYNRMITGKARDDIKSPYLSQRLIPGLKSSRLTIGLAGGIGVGGTVYGGIKHSNSPRNNY